MGLNIYHTCTWIWCLFLSKMHLLIYLLGSGSAEDILVRTEKEMTVCGRLCLLFSSQPCATLWNACSSPLRTVLVHATKETHINYRLGKRVLECCGGTFHFSRKECMCSECLPSCMSLLLTAPFLHVVIFFIFFALVCMIIRFSCVQLFATLWTVTCQAPLSTGFSRQECWSGLPWPSPGYLSNPGAELLHLLHWQAGSLPLVQPGKP